MSDRSLVPLKKLHIDGGTQMRAVIDEEYVADLAAIIKDGEKLPDAVAYYDGASYWLADGFHRYHGHARAGRDAMLCEVRTGTQRDAKLYAAGCNGQHGLRRTNADKRKAAAELLADPEWCKASDRWVADQCKVNHHLVAEVRKELEESHKEVKSDKPSDGRGSTPTSQNNPSQNSQKTRTDRNGRQQPAHKAPPILCDRCTRSAPGKGLPDCPQCAVLRKKAVKKKEKKKPPERAELKDKLGTVLPDRCRDAFADPQLADLIAGVESLEAMLDPESVTDKAGKLCPSYPFILIEKVKEHAYDAKEALQNLRAALEAGLPHAVCPACAGRGESERGAKCRTCRQSGHVPSWKHAEMEAAKS